MRNRDGNHLLIKRKITQSNLNQKRKKKMV